MKTKIHFGIFSMIFYFLKKRANDLILKNKLMFEKNVFVGLNVVLDPEYPWLISIGKNSRLAKGVVILAHDGSTKLHTGYSKIGRVVIGEDTFIGINSIILPHVNIGNNVIIGAGSVVTSDIPDNCVAAGNPAKVICSTSEIIEKHKQKMLLSPIYENGWTSRTGITEKQKEKMNEDLKQTMGYII